MERRRDRHPEPGRLESFMRVGLPRGEVRELVRHLLSGCRTCLAVTGRLWLLGDRQRGKDETTAGPDSGSARERERPESKLTLRRREKP